MILTCVLFACNNAGTDGTYSDSSVVTSPEGSYPQNTSDSANIRMDSGTVDSSRMDTTINRPAY